MNFKSRALGLVLCLITFGTVYGMEKRVVKMDELLEECGEDDNGEDSSCNLPFEQAFGYDIIQARQITENFDRIKISSLINVLFLKGEALKINVIGDAYLVDSVKIGVVERVLIIGCDERRRGYKGVLTCEIILPRSVRLKEITKEGTGYLKGEVRFRPDGEGVGTLYVFDSGEIDLKVEARKSMLIQEDSGTFKVMVDADKVLFFGSGLGVKKLQVEADVLEVTAHSESPVEVSGNVESSIIKEREKGVCDFTQLNSKKSLYCRFDADDKLIEEKKKF